MSNIKTVTKQPLIDDNSKHNYVVVYNDDKEWTVPHDENNTMYQEILKWVDAGNTIEESE